MSLSRFQQAVARYRAGREAIAKPAFDELRLVRKLERKAFTLVELLVTLAIIGVLAAMTLPGIQAARENARLSQCQNNLRQLGVAFLNHEQAQGHLPTGGWGYRWIGEPDAGYGRDQPGGWAYNILAYMEHDALRNLGRGGVDRFADPMNATRQAAFQELLSAPLAVLNCPSKRPNERWPYAYDPLNPFIAVNSFSCSYSNGCRVARCDYRVNSGSKTAADQPGPALVQDPETYSWKFKLQETQNGICYQRSAVRMSQITDGASKTLIAGEKYLNPNRYFDGEDSADDQCVFTGHDRDNAGYTANGSESMPPQRDRPGLGLSFYFGSPHAAGLNVVLCDGSSQLVQFDVDEDVWRRFGGRNESAG